MALTKLNLASGVTGNLNLATNVTGTLPTSNYVQGGITEADQWRLTTSFTGDANPIASNWERNDTNFDKIGTGLTESNGIFSFPETGIYKIEFQHVGQIQNNNPSQYNEAKIRVTSNNSSYDSRSIVSSLGIQTNGTNGQFTNYCNYIVDVTDISNVKIQFSIDVAYNDTQTIGHTNRHYTAMTSIRLGDT